MLNLNWKTLQNGAVVLLALYILPKILPWLLLFAVVAAVVWLNRRPKRRNGGGKRCRCRHRCRCR